MPVAKITLEAQKIIDQKIKIKIKLSNKDLNFPPCVSNISNIGYNKFFGHLMLILLKFG